MIPYIYIVYSMYYESDKMFNLGAMFRTIVVWERTCTLSHTAQECAAVLILNVTPNTGALMGIKMHGTVVPIVWCCTILKVAPAVSVHSAVH